MLDEFDFTAYDGTRLRGWRNANTDGPKVLVCNGMGVPPQAWPRLIEEDCHYQVAGWNHRGVLGSERPADRSNVDIEDHVADAVTLMNELGWDRAILVAWSLGVNVSFELAREYPTRVTGILSVAGVPGGTFDTIMEPLLVPTVVRRPLGIGLARVGQFLGKPIDMAVKAIPTDNRVFAEWFRHSGIMLPYGDIKDVQAWTKAFFSQDFDWYFDLALGLERHGKIDPSFIDCPVTIVAGVLDGLTSHSAVLEYAERIPHAEVHSLPGSHMLPLEFPDRIMTMLRDLHARAVAYEAQLDAHDEMGRPADVTHLGDRDTARADGADGSDSALRHSA